MSASRKRLPAYAESAPRSLREQATDERLAALKAQKYVRCGETVADLTAGLGSDVLAFARAGARAIAVEISSEYAQFLRRHLPSSVEVACARAEDFDRACDLIYLDPSRRTDAGKRAPGLYSPDPFALAPRLLNLAPRVLVKLSPLFSPARAAARFVSLKECRVVSLNGEVKEVLALMERGF
ncbi:MAG: hypothetical protein RMM53_00785, partial [Bacteroidia bacterium]|nr:hypothetical protein [Bacteroidia bacterium]MDW8332731.1 hypothetical protein [Bacteroidia bacterium]